MKQALGGTISLLGAALLFFGFAVAGCSQTQDTSSPDQQKQASRLSEITKKTGGDWNKLTPADKQYLIQEIGKGDEGIARSVLQMNVPRTPPHGPPARPGHPAGPP